MNEQLYLPLLLQKKWVVLVHNIFQDNLILQK